MTLALNVVWMGTFLDGELYLERLDRVLSGEDEPGNVWVFERSFRNTKTVQSH